jgi:hypothetical protein
VNEYETLIGALLGAARTWTVLLSGVPNEELQRALRTLDRAGAIGAIVDPTRYREQIQTRGLERQRAVVQATLAFRRALREVFPNDPLLRALQEGEPLPLEGPSEATPDEAGT